MNKDFLHLLSALLIFEVSCEILCNNYKETEKDEDICRRLKIEED